MAYQPRMTDPVSGRKMKKGQPVPAANAAPPNYNQQRTIRPVARIKQAGPDQGRVQDPNTGQPMIKGQPVPTAYSGALNQRVGLGLETAGRALGMGFKPPPDLAGTPNPQPPTAPSAPTRNGLSPRGLATPAATPRGPKATRTAPLAAPGARGAPITGSSVGTSLDQLAAQKPNTPGYSDFPPTKRTKAPNYPY